ncbi:LysR family transcriptional regulator [Lacrimispora amygdalina]|uniref:LysR family transcriptional regulator n=1 Tax=Lacrimispora amygdalina TaxID=253257 RepID=A0ABQ5M0S6_9FIRM|nr:LysR family transcriptional regulator [uncultured Clostridium sp.]
MSIRHLRIFLTVCECNNSITRAAKKLYMTQPSVSVAIQELEKYYGIILFDRISRRLYLTEAGRQFLEYAQRIFALLDDMEKGIRNWDTIGVLRVGASITIGSQFMPSYVEKFSAIYPEAEVQVFIGTSHQLEQKLLNNELDFALVERPVHESSLVAEPYMEDSLAVIAPGRSPYYPGQVLKKEELSGQKFLLREHGSGTRELFEEVMEKEDITVKPVWEGMSTTALVNAVIHGLGIAVVPRRMVSGPLEKKLVYPLKIEGAEFKRCFYIVHHKDKLLTRTFQEFIDLCRCYELDYPLPKYNGL